MKKLDLDILREGLPGVSATRGAFYREAVIVGLKRQGFSSGVVLTTSGEFQESFEIEWSQDIEEEDVESWRDEVQIASFGAVGIAILLMIELLGFRNYQKFLVPESINQRSTNPLWGNGTGKHSRRCANVFQYRPSR